jgi:transcriptional regulator with XRE-family HTH domain
MSEEKDQLTLATLRKRAGLTQRQLADRLGITIKTISAWERGVVEPRLTFAESQRLMKVLQCTFEELVEATSKPPERQSLPEKD